MPFIQVYLFIRDHCWYIEPRNRKKVLDSFDNVFHVYSMNGLQRYQKKNFTVAFWDNPHYPFWDVHGESDKSENIFGIWKQANVSFEALLVGNQGWPIKGQMLR